MTTVVEALPAERPEASRASDRSNRSGREGVLRGGRALSFVLIAVRALLAVLILIYFVSASFYDHAADFKSFYSAGFAVRHPEIPLYDLIALDENPFGEVFKLAPPAAVYLVPFSFGSIQQARLAWRVVLVLAFAIGYAILMRALDVRLLSGPWLAGLGLWSVFGPLQIAVGEGQWDPIFLLLTALATYAVKWRREVLAAIAIAVAASVKPYPLCLIGYFLARRAWKPALATLGVLAGLTVVGSLLVGLDEAMAFATRVLPASGATTTYADNQALGGLLARIVSSDLKPFPLRDSGAIDLTIRSVALALFGVTVWLVARRPASDSDGDARRRMLQLSLFVPLSILVVPAAWTHYETILLVPLTLLAADQKHARPRQPLGWLLLAACYVVLMLPNPTMLYGPELDRALWLRSRADAANLALQRLYPTALDRLILSYKTFAIVALYGMLAWRVARPNLGSPDAAGVPGESAAARRDGGT